MAGMSTFQEIDHPRADSGRFINKPQSAPELSLAAAEAATAATANPGRLAIDVHGRANIEAELRVGTLPVNTAVGVLISAADQAADVDRGAWAWGQIVHPDGDVAAWVKSKPSVADLERAANVAYWLSVAGKGKQPEPITGSDTLWNADREVEYKQGLGEEIHDDTARVIALDLITRLPSDRAAGEFPNLAELAAAPQNFGRERYQAVADELTSIYERLTPAQRSRADMVYTWLLNHERQ